MARRILLFIILVVLVGTEARRRRRQIHGPFETTTTSAHTHPTHPSNPHHTTTEAPVTTQQVMDTVTTPIADHLSSLVTGQLSSLMVTDSETTVQVTMPVTTPAIVRSNTTKDYEEALRLSLLFYYAQRSGQLPADNPIPWRADSALSDCVVGGWYDAGDHVKFTFPMASALTDLLWGVDRFQDGYQTAGQLDKMYDTVHWALDYLLHAWDPFTQELVIQVGDPSIDHQNWQRPEDMTEPRPCTKIGPGRPGSDVAGQVVAALAAGAIVFRNKGDAAFANRLLETAESIYRFAEKNRGKYTDLPHSGQDYKSSGEKDEMCLAGVWLYKATADERYLVNAKHDYLSGVPDELSWDDKMAACQLMLYEETKSDNYKHDVQNFLQSFLPDGSEAYSPCGLVLNNATDTSSSATAGNVGFYALLAAEDGINSDANRKWAAEQINYLLGDNTHEGGCFSYEIGYGSKYPTKPHHRAASCPNPPDTCTDANLNTDSANPHVLSGGLVGGPAQTDAYTDTRQDTVHNGVAVVNNAGFQSTLAGLVHLVIRGALPTTANKCACTQ